jgi:hypothetical protein
LSSLRDALALPLGEALRKLLAEGWRVRVEPYVPPSSGWSAASWRVARQTLDAERGVVLVVVPEIEGRVSCSEELPKR